MFLIVCIPIHKVDVAHIYARSSEKWEGGSKRSEVASIRYPSEQLCTVSTAECGADMQFAPEGFAPRWSLPSPLHAEEAKLPKGYSAYRTTDQSIRALSRSQRATCYVVRTAVQ